MQERELNRATISAANRTVISGRPTAEKTNRSFRFGQGSRLQHVACSSFLGSLMVASLFVGLAPTRAWADDDKDRRGEDLRAEITALQAQFKTLQSTVSALESQVSTLEAGNTRLQNEINSLKSSNTTLQSQLVDVQSNHALALGPYVRVDPNPEIGVIGPNIIFSGANIHIVSGSGSTDDYGTPSGLGNLIIGYDEDPDPQKYVDRSPFGNLPLSTLRPGDRGGSHNLVIGAANRFTQATYGGIVVGTANTIDGYGASVSGGAGNTARSYGASVSAGFSNYAGSLFSSVSGGRYNTAALFFTSVSGGAGNLAGGDYASVSGGSGNNAFDDFTSITGGTGNTAGSVVTFQGGLGSTVIGGSGNAAGGRNTVVIGGQNVTDNNDNSIAPKPPFP